jgi:hypothetical protein
MKPSPFICSEITLNDLVFLLYCQLEIVQLIDDVLIGLCDVEQFFPQGFVLVDFDN